MSERPQPDLTARSVAVVLAGQHHSGGYVACPTYPTYRYAWLRDGAWCAHAMDRSGERSSAAAFHDFVSRTVLENRALFDAAITPGRHGNVLAAPPPTRYTLTGQVEPPGSEQWPNFQLDGYGTWLWTLAEHVRAGQRLTEQQREAARLVAAYLRETGTSRCYDCWEEHREQRHTATLGAVIAGLMAAADLLDEPNLARAADEFGTLLFDRHVRSGSFVKHDATDLVDASLLWLGTPFGIVEPTGDLMRRTTDRVARELTGPTGGLRRYLGDTFYGGGEWVLLTAWLGWHFAATGDLDGAHRQRDWIHAVATAEGDLPEQVTTAPQDPAMVRAWQDRWGPVATPLLWSHAMYLLLTSSL
jgi:GH15 family glucan-1,4-alpha-glucosidase